MKIIVYGMPAPVWQPEWLQGQKDWAAQKRSLLSARMSAGGFHAQDARDMTELSRLTSLFAELDWLPELKVAGDDWTPMDKRWVQGWNDCVKSMRKQA